MDSSPVDWVELLAIVCEKPYVVIFSKNIDWKRPTSEDEDKQISERYSTFMKMNQGTSKSKMEVPMIRTSIPIMDIKNGLKELLPQLLITVNVKMLKLETIYSATIISITNPPMNKKEETASGSLADSSYIRSVQTALSSIKLLSDQQAKVVSVNDSSAQIMQADMALLSDLLKRGITESRVAEQGVIGNNSYKPLVNVLDEARNYTEKIENENSKKEGATKVELVNGAKDQIEEMNKEEDAKKENAANYDKGSDQKKEKTRNKNDLNEIDLKKIRDRVVIMINAADDPNDWKNIVEKGAYEAIISQRLKANKKELLDAKMALQPRNDFSKKKP